jgi:YD repeat-containing protein
MNSLTSRCQASILALAAVLGMGAAAADAKTLNDDLPQVYTMTPTGVNLQTGGFMHGKTDLAMGPLEFVRSWRSTPSFSPTSALAQDDHAFGGWNHNYGFGVSVGAGPSSQIMANVHIEGRRVQFRWNGSNWDTWDADSQGSGLTVANGRFTFTSKSGDVYSFTTHPATRKGTTNTNVGSEGIQLIQQVDYADGHRLHFTYDASARLRTVISNRGYAIVLDYGANGRIQTACGYNMSTHYIDANSTCAASTLKTSYAYVASSTTPLLSGVTDLAGKLTSLSYDALSFWANLTCVSIPESQTCEIFNQYGMLPGDTLTVHPDQVRRQTTATGEVWNFRYTHPDPDNPAEPGNLRRSSATMIDPKGNETGANYYGGYIEALITPAGITNYEFNGTVLRSFILPEANIIILERDGRQNLIERRHKAKPGSGLPDIVSTASYPADRYEPANNFLNRAGCQAASQKLCDKPNWIADAKGNVTDFTYDPAHGGMLTETGPAVNGVTPQKRYSYQQRYAWISNGAGGHVQASTSVWLLTSMSYCKTGNPAPSGTGCANGPSDEVVTLYDYGPDSGPNNLQLRGTIVDPGGLNRRTCVSYDAQGNRISETGAKGTTGLQACP